MCFFFVTGPPGKKGYIQKNYHYLYFYTSFVGVCHTMEAQKKVKYTLAGASSTVFFSKIASFIGQESRILSPAYMRYHDQNKTSFNVQWHAVLIIGSDKNDDFSENVKASVQSYLCNCTNLKELSMVFASPMFLFGPTLVNFIRTIMPSLSRLKVYKTYECENWIVETTLGEMFIQNINLTAFLLLQTYYRL